MVIGDDLVGGASTLPARSYCRAPFAQKPSFIPTHRLSSDFQEHTAIALARSM